ncbi:MAG: 5'-nucleotidase C-terminal domain-containing protein [Clostridia bacterium]|nr:5'-nucleotidase C-terminal domain-containing protein [Clostridia bacterium]
MNKTFIKLTSFILILTLLIPCIMSCTKQAPSIELQNIIILFTADSNGEISDNIGYDGVAAYRYEMKGLTDYVTTVDLGNAFAKNGGDLNSAETVANTMNRVGYDYGILSENEIGLNLENFENVTNHNDLQYLACNISYTGNGQNHLKSIKPYDIVKYGAVDVAYIGVVSPDLANSSAFTEGEEKIYELQEAKTAFYSTVQSYIDECDELGAEYIVLLSHLSETEDKNYLSGIELAKNTSGANAILNGDTTTPGCVETENKNGDMVYVGSCGSNFSAIGKLVIKTNGKIELGTVSDYTKKDTAINSYLEKTGVKVEEKLGEVVGESDYDISVNDENGIRMTHIRETAIGDLCADAFRYVFDADIGLIAGDEIGEGIRTGELTGADLKAVMPRGHRCCVIEATGQEIVDALDMACKDLLIATSENGAAVGEFDGFLQVSGVKFEVIGYYVTAVELDSNGMYNGLEEGGLYRVTNVMVETSKGEYTPIDLEKTYTVAASNYILKQSGYGYSMFADNNCLVDSTTLDYQILAQYISHNLGGEILEKYTAPDQRIVIKTTAR